MTFTTAAHRRAVDALLAKTERAVKQQAATTRRWGQPCRSDR
jgi:hypothetical protein